MKRVNSWMRVWLLLAVSAFAPGALAAVCTSLSAGDWNVAGRWSCGHIPLAADTVVIAHNAIRMRGNYAVAGITINAGALLNGNGQNLTVNGAVVVIGTYDTAGGDLTTTGGGALTVNAGGTFNFNNGNSSISGDVVVNGTLTSGGDNLQMTGTNTTLSGTGNVVGTTLEIDATGVSVPAGANLVFDANSEIDVGANNPGSLTVSGTIDGTAQAAGDRIIRVSNGGALIVGTTGVVNAPNSRLDVRDGATVTNNGTITIGDLRGRNRTPAPVFTQGANSTLNINLTACDAANPCTFNASAAGNTVNYSGAAQTILTPSGATYANLTLSGSGAKTVPTGLTVAENFTMSGTATVAAPAALTVGGDFIIGAGNTFTPGTGTVTLNGAAMQTIDSPNPVNFNNLTVTNGSNPNLELTSNVTVAGILNGMVNLKSTCPTNYMLISNGGATVVESCPGGLNHMAISTSATEMVFVAVPVTLTPHDAAHGAISNAGAINLSTSTGFGDWTIGNGTGILAPGAANSGLATYTFGAGETSAALDFTYQTAATVTLNVTNAGGADLLLNTPAGEKANTITFTTPNFVFTDSACVHNIAFGALGQTCVLFSWSPQVAGQDAPNVYITSVDTAGVPRRLSGTQTRTRDLQFGLSCHDPLANAGKMATFAGVAPVTLPVCQASGALPAAWSAILTATFPAGIPSAGPFTFNYPDVGKVELWMRNSATTTQRGASGTFVVKPGGFVLSNIVRTSDSFANPGATSAADICGGATTADCKFVKAGEDFSVTVTATTCTPASATCTVAGAATPNYGKEVAPESVKLTPLLVAGLGLTGNPVIGGTFGAFAAGEATGTAFTWGEVGIVTLTPSVGDGDYLGELDVSGTPTGNVGRFYAAKFALSAGAIANRSGLAGCSAPTGCGTFTYMGEQMSASFTLTAKAVDGTTTLQNYNWSATPANQFAKLDPTAAGNPLALAAVDSAVTTRTPFPPCGGTPAHPCLTPQAAAGSFASGVANVTVPFTVYRDSTTATGPYSLLDIGIAPQDSDGAIMAAYDLDTVNVVAGTPNHTLLGQTQARYGRMKLSNAHGSELLRLPISVTAQYWDGTTYVTNALDNNSTFAATDVTFVSYTAPLSAANYPNSGATSVTPASVVFVNGAASYKLAKPGSGNNGSVDMTVNSLSAYLPSNTSRATFGVYKGNNEFIYLREAY